MKVSREQAAENRTRIIETASRLFRERGVDGIGVADLMKAAGLTHGGFYGHFASKEDLVAQACDRALAGSQAEWERLIAAHPDDPLAAITARYLSAAHRDKPGQGCVFSALGNDVARQGPPIRGKITQGLRDLAETLARIIPGKSKAARREKALATFASMVGGLMLARSVDDPVLSDEILAAVSASVTASTASDRRA